jgi:small subunit ribosomal protein S4
MIKKAYAPGIIGKRRRASSLSEYGKELKEKQKLKNWYNLSERQLKEYVKKSLAVKRSAKSDNKEKNFSTILLTKLETRLDNVIFRLGFASSRAQARQIVSHSHFLVNKKPVNIPSYALKKGDKITVRPGSVKKKFFQDLIPALKRKTQLSWLKFEADKLKGEIVNSPTLEEVAPPVEIAAVFEYYSR